MAIVKILMMILVPCAVLAKSKTPAAADVQPLRQSLANYKAVLNAVEEQSGVKYSQIKNIHLSDLKGKVEFIDQNKKCTFLPVEVVIGVGNVPTKARFTTNTMSSCE